MFQSFIMQESIVEAFRYSCMDLVMVFIIWKKLLGYYRIRE